MSSSTLWNDVLEAMEFPIFIVDAQKKIIFANRAVNSLVQRLGYVEPGTVTVGRNLFEAVPKLPAALAQRYDELIATGKPQEDEREFLVNGESLWFRSRRFPLFENGRVSHVVTILSEETALRASQEALKRSERTSRAIIDASSESILLANVDGTIVALNEVAAARLRRPPQEIIGRNGSELLPDEVWRRRQPLFKEVIRSGRQMTDRDAREGIAFETTMYPVLDEAGNVRQVAVYAADITDKVKAQEELIRIRQAVQSSSDAIGMSDMSGRHVFSNPAFEKLFGLTVEQISAAGGPKSVYSDQAVADEVFATILAGKPWSGIVAMNSRDGRELLVDLRADAIRDAEGNLIGLIGIHTDVTTQQLAAEQLKRSEEQFRLLFGSIPVPAFIWEREDDDVVLRGYNQAAEKMTRGGIVNYVGHKASRMYQHRPDIQRDLQDCHDTQTIIFREMSYEYHSVKDERFLSVHYVPIPPNLILVHTIDLTDRKRTETELQLAHNELERKVDERTKSLQRQIEFDVLVRRLLTSFAISRSPEIDEQIVSSLRDLARFFDAEHSFIALLSPDGTSYRLSHTWAEKGMYDFAAEYEHSPFGTVPWVEQRILAGMSVSLSTLDDLPPEAAVDRQRFESEGVKSALLAPLRGRGGKVTGSIGLRSYSHTIQWSEDHQRWLQTVGDAVANVLERRVVEQELVKSEQRLLLHVKQTPLAVIEWDTDFRVISWNPAAEEIFGYSAEEAMGKHSDFIIPGETRKATDQIWKRLLSQKGGARSTNANVTREGKTIICEWYNTPLTNADGMVIGVASLAQNVTDRIQAQNDLAQAYRRLQVEQDALKQKNIALHELVEQVQESRKSTATQIQSNLDRMVLPILERVSTRLDPEGQEYLSVARSNLADILSPYVSELENRFKRLSPREIEICELIRRGYDSKQIADLRNSSVQTVLKQRKMIRKKLGLDQKKVNLATYLSSGFPAQKKREKR